MIKFNWGMRACSIFLLWAGAAVALPAQTFTSLDSFNGTDGKNPSAGLVQGADGNLYGSTYTGGANGSGAVFNITPSGTLTTFYNFGGPDGGSPFGVLVQDINGTFYGTTYDGGVNNLGTVFKITPSGMLTTMHSFGGPDGANPWAGLTQGSDGNFYGTTEYGGTNKDGTVFTITPSGTLTTLYSFCSQGGLSCTDGAYPYARLVQGQGLDGNFYGTTEAGGAGSACSGGCGTVFSITAGGTLTTLHSFVGSPTDGAQPYAAQLVQGTDGNFYGITQFGGGNGVGTVFNIRPGGNLTMLYSFCAQSNCTDGTKPYAGLVQGTDGNFYGTAGGGGANGDWGTIFQITPSGALTTLHSFDATDGNDPGEGLVQDTNGTFYGTTFYGGANNEGTVFSLSVGLGPFVEPNPASGTVGAAVNILGTSLTGATSVTFNGTAATFTVVSGSEITTTVPTGATTGTVQVVTPSGTLSSNIPFTVTVVTLMPTSLPFGNQLVGTTSTGQNVMLTNTGTTTVTISSIAITGIDTGDFAQTNNCGSTVAAGGSCTIMATFTPLAGGNLTASISITDNAPASPQAVSLSGTGTGTAVKLTPTKLTFPTQLEGTSSAGMTVTLKNTGTVTLTIISVGLTGTDAGDFSETNTCGGSLGKGKSCTFSVVFNPTGIKTRRASLSITDNAPRSPQTVVLTGMGTEVELAPSSLNFGSETVGMTSAPMSATLTNIGATSLTITSIGITGTNAGDFAQMNTSCGRKVSAGASCTISVTFTPTAQGPRSASVSISDDGGGSPQQVTLSGTGT
jgi:uncharacterized repeat protein (TIGR03803 family)